MDGLGSVSTTKLDWNQKMGIKTHINQEKEDSPISSLSTGTFLILKATILAFSAMIRPA